MKRTNNGTSLVLALVTLLAAALACVSPAYSAMGTYCSSPPFLTTNVKPNILIIMDNSNSMDEDYVGNAVGSFATNSKSASGHAALYQIINTYQGKMNIGIMTYKLPTSSVNKVNLSNAAYFASYQLKSYCPSPPDECVTYCQTDDATAQATCQDSCAAQNASFDATYKDEIVTTGTGYPVGDTRRNSYCSNIYPKTQRTLNTLDGTNYVYFKQALPYYYSSTGYEFFYSPTYCTRDYNDSGGCSVAPYAPYNAYKYYGSKTGTGDDETGYATLYGTYALSPTDTDFAMGYLNFGRRLMSYYVGKTWFNNTSPGIGYLKQAVADVTGTHLTNLLAEVATKTETEYTTCTNADKNTCTYIINAGLTPTEGTIESARQYFTGTLSGSTSPIQYTCQKNYIIYVTDGLPSVNTSGVTDTADNLMPGVLTKIDALRSITYSVSGTSTAFDIKTYVIGLGMTESAKTKLDDMAVHGGTDDSGHAYYVDSPDSVQAALNAIFELIFKETASGTSASILGEKGKLGQNILQVAFYPSREFNATTSVKWVGYLHNFWLYVSTKYENIREDTVNDYILNLSTDHIVNFTFNETTKQLVVEEWSDPLGKGYGTTALPDKTIFDTKPIWEAGKKLFLRTASETATDKRNIYTNVKDPSGGGSDTYPKSAANGLLIEFRPENKTTLEPYLGYTSIGTTAPTMAAPSLSSNGSLIGNKTYYYKVSATADGNSWTDLSTEVSKTTTSSPSKKKINLSWSAVAGATTYRLWRGTAAGGEDRFYDTSSTSITDDGVISFTLASSIASSLSVTDLIPYVRGTDKTGLRGRTVTIDADTNTWKLGDIIYSTPLIESYTDYSVVYVGANDGMLHAIRLGKLSTTGLSTHEIAKLVGQESGNVDLGKELWSFIPRHSLPYLRYLPNTSYCHIYFADLHPYVFYPTSSKKILIGGMRLGAGCGCIVGGGGSCTSDPVIQPPTDTCANNRATDGSCIGLSSYFALDVTDPVNPVLLWEWTDPDLGFSYSGPAVITRDKTTSSSGTTMVMFLNGPQTYEGLSYQDLKTFTLTLDSTNYTISGTPYKYSGFNINNAFGGRLFTNGVDVNEDGNTDYVVFGFTEAVGGSSTNLHGGLINLYTGGTNPSNVQGNCCGSTCWEYNKSFFNDTAPYTAKVAVGKCFDRFYLFAGSGKYFTAAENYTTSHVDHLYGVPFDCDATGCCNLGTINNAHSSASAMCKSLLDNNDSVDPWKIELLDSGVDSENSLSYLKERLVSDPTLTSSNMAFFATTKPSSDICAYGGRSRAWGLNCATSGSVIGKPCTTDADCDTYFTCATSTTIKTCDGVVPGNSCKAATDCASGETCQAIKSCECTGHAVTDPSGTLFMQLSTAAIYQLKVDSASSQFTYEGGKDGRTSSFFTGITPESSPPFSKASTSKTGTLIHFIER